MVDVAIHDKEEQIAARMRQATLNNRKPETLPPESGVSGKRPIGRNRSQKDRKEQK